MFDLDMAGHVIEIAIEGIDTLSQVKRYLPKLMSIDKSLTSY